MRNGTDRIGQVIASASDEAGMQEIMAKVYACIEVDGQPLEKLWGLA